jgi:hypothetical protein
VGRKLEQRLCLTASPYAGFLTRKRYRHVKALLGVIRYCVKRLVEMKRYQKRRKSHIDKLVMQAVTEKRDALIKAAVQKETARLEALQAKLSKLDASHRANMWLTEDDIQSAKTLTKHDFEVMSPPPFRSADPSKSDTYVLAEHYELLAPDHAVFHMLLLDADKVMLLYQWVARVYGVNEVLWSLNFWRAVENARSMFSDPWLVTRLKSRLVNIVDKYLAPECANPAKVMPGSAKRAIDAAAHLRALSFMASGIGKWAQYGRALAALHQCQFEAFCFLRGATERAFFESDLGRPYMQELQAARMAKWKKEAEVVMAKRMKEIADFTRECKALLDHRAALRREAIDNQAESAMEVVSNRVAEELISESAQWIAELYNDVLDEVLIVTVDSAEKTVVEDLFMEAAEIVIEETYIEEHSTFMVDEVVLPLVLEAVVTDAMDEGTEAYLEAVDQMGEAATARAGEAVVESIIEAALWEVRENMAALIVQCWWRQRLAIRKSRKQLAKFVVKRWDPSSQYYYYMNTQTGDTSWEKPKIIARLYPALQNNQTQVLFAGGATMTVSPNQTRMQPAASRKVDSKKSDKSTAVTSTSNNKVSASMATTSAASVVPASNTSKIAGLAATSKARKKNNY